MWRMVMMALLAAAGGLASSWLAHADGAVYDPQRDPCTVRFKSKGHLLRIDDIEPLLKPKPGKASRLDPVPPKQSVTVPGELLRVEPSTIRRAAPGKLVRLELAEPLIRPKPERLLRVEPVAPVARARREPMECVGPAPPLARPNPASVIRVEPGPPLAQPKPAKLICPEPVTLIRAQPAPPLQSQEPAAPLARPRPAELLRTEPVEPVGQPTPQPIIRRWFCVGGKLIEPRAKPSES